MQHSDQYNMPSQGKDKVKPLKTTEPSVFIGFSWDVKMHVQAGKEEDQLLLTPSWLPHSLWCWLSRRPRLLLHFLDLAVTATKMIWTKVQCSTWLADAWPLITVSLKNFSYKVNKPRLLIPELKVWFAWLLSKMWGGKRRGRAFSASMDVADRLVWQHLGSIFWSSDVAFCESNYQPTAPMRAAYGPKGKRICPLPLAISVRPRGGHRALRGFPRGNWLFLWRRLFLSLPPGRDSRFRRDAVRPLQGYTARVVFAKVLI